MDLLRTIAMVLLNTIIMVDGDLMYHFAANFNFHLIPTRRNSLSLLA